MKAGHGDGRYFTCLGIVFDLDGVLIDSEPVWAAVRGRYTIAAGGVWRASAQREMMGMTSCEWQQFMHDELRVPQSAEQIGHEVLTALAAEYASDVPVFPGAVEVLVALHRRWPLGLASSSSRELIGIVLDRLKVGPLFSAVVSSEEVAEGKPSPAVYLECARRLDLDPQSLVAVEDSTNGLVAAASAGMKLVAVPNKDYPATADALGRANKLLRSVSELSELVVHELEAS